MPGKIEDYALIGDCTTTALVGRDGSIDWLCWPRFDSGACFTALLGNDDHGRWLLAPENFMSTSRRYRHDTLILETDFETADGAVRIIDFMPIQETRTSLIRIVKGLRGRVKMQMELIIRFDYGVTLPWVNRVDDTTMTAVAGPELIVIRSNVAIRGEDMRSVAEFEVAEGDSRSFSMTYGRSYFPLPGYDDPEDLLAQTEKFWTGWIAKSVTDGPYIKNVRRSLITLKALTYRWTGGIVAAATTSLPEKLGGPRNWDYRFCWLRDTTFTLFAFMHAGFYEEAGAWRQWLLRAVAGSPAQFQIMYGVGGERRLTELELPWLPGYEGSAPVRIGNRAAQQLQLDVFGELIDSLAQGAKGGLPSVPRAFALRRASLEHLEQIWREPDEGIWEIRGEPRHFTHSKVMAWVAFQRATTWQDPEETKETCDHWAATAATIHEEVCREGFDPELNSFVQHYESKNVDASLLMLALVGFLPADDPRIIGTIKAIEKTLLFDGLVVRYQTEQGVDGLPPGEGAFLACSFWLVDNYILAGRVEEARLLFEQLLGLTNDLGLLSEQYDPNNKRMLGNFPQAFSHVAIVNTALNLTQDSCSVADRSDSGDTTQGS